MPRQVKPPLKRLLEGRAHSRPRETPKIEGFRESQDRGPTETDLPSRRVPASLPALFLWSSPWPPHLESSQGAAVGPLTLSIADKLDRVAGQINNIDANVSLILHVSGALVAGLAAVL